MDTRPPPLDDTTLHAWVDGQLPPDEAARVARALTGQPEATARVAAWQDQRAGLQALHAGLLDEPVPARLIAALQPSPAPVETVRTVAAATTTPTIPPASNGAFGRAWERRHGALAASVLLALTLGAGLGWTARGVQPDHAPTLAGPAVPAFVRDAATAHVLYVPEQRHPVEVGAEQQQHLVQWLSKRLGRALRVPVLAERGWSLVGGRLLPAGESDPGDGSGALARAQFMYENAAGERLTLYVAVTGADGAGPLVFRLGATPGARDGQVVPRSLYWIDGAMGYALTGTLSADALTELARQVHRQLGA